MKSEDYLVAIFLDEVEQIFFRSVRSGQRDETISSVFSVMLLGDWKQAFTGNVTNADDTPEPEADFSKPGVVGQATKRRKS